VTLESGETIERPVPAIVSSALQAKAQAATARNRRFSGGKPGHDYLLRSLVFCEHCGASYVGNGSSDRRTGKRYSYYSCSRRRLRYDRRTEGLTCPHVNAEWLEGKVWADVRRFLHDPGEVLDRVREQGLGSGIDAAEAQARLDRLQQRLAERREAKAEHVRAFVAAKGGISEDEFAEYTTDLNAQIENLQLLISSAEADLDAHEEERLAAVTTEAWLLTLRQRLAEVEADTDEARRQRRELVELLVEKIIVAENGDGGATVMITYRFGPPVREQGEPSEEISHGLQDSVEPDHAEYLPFPLGHQGVVRGVGRDLFEAPAHIFGRTRISQLGHEACQVLDVLSASLSDDQAVQGRCLLRGFNLL
jgi:site-specific DNA recombinase